MSLFLFPPHFPFSMYLYYSYILFSLSSVHISRISTVPPSSVAALTSKNLSDFTFLPSPFNVNRSHISILPPFPAAAITSWNLYASLRLISSYIPSTLPSFHRPSLPPSSHFSPSRSLHSLSLYFYPPNMFLFLPSLHSFFIIFPRLFFPSVHPSISYYFFIPSFHPFTLLIPFLCSAFCLYLCPQLSLPFILLFPFIYFLFTPSILPSRHLSLPFHPHLSTSILLYAFNTPFPSSCSSLSSAHLSIYVFLYGLNASFPSLFSLSLQPQSTVTGTVLRALGDCIPRHQAAA